MVCEVCATIVGAPVDKLRLDLFPTDPFLDTLKPVAVLVGLIFISRMAISGT